MVSQPGTVILLWPKCIASELHVAVPDLLSTHDSLVQHLSASKERRGELVAKVPSWKPSPNQKEII